MDFRDEEILQLFRLLQQHRVKYLLVGGFAVNLHGYNRFTEDIDLWVKDDSENRRHLRAAFEELLNTRLPELDRMQFIAGWSIIKLPSGFPIDLMSDVKGLEPIGFDTCLNQAQVVRLEDITIPFLHINHLRETKIAAGRPKDLLDLDELNKIHRE